MFLWLDKNTVLSNISCWCHDGISEDNLHFADQSKRVFLFFLLLLFLKEIEIMFFMFLSSYRNTKKFYHRVPIEVACLSVCLKYKEMYGNIEGLHIINLYRGQNGGFEWFGGFYIDCYYTLYYTCLLITCSNSQQNPPNHSNLPFWSTEMTIHNNWGRFTFILSFNIDITILNISNLRYEDLQYSHTFLYISNIQTDTPLVWAPCASAW